jgi:hypothetical protein
VALTKYGNHTKRSTMLFIPNTRMIRGPMKFQVQINIKNANGLTNLMFKILLMHVSKTTFQQVQQRVKVKAMNTKHLRNYKFLKLLLRKKFKKNSKTS